MTRVIVCGGGTAGCILAGRLTEDPDVSVVLLEAGPDYASLEDMPSDVRDSWNFGGTDHDWGYVSDDVVGGADSSPFLSGVPDRGSIYAYRGKVMGGSSAVNAAGANRPPREDFDRWVGLGNDWWSWEHVLPTFRALEDYPTDGDLRDLHGRGGPVPIRRLAREDLRPLYADFLTAAAGLGHRVLDDPNGGVSGVSPYPMNSVDRVRQSASICYLAPARSRSNLEVRSDVMVDRVEMEGSRARGVRLASGDVLHGDVVVLTAGALSSPAILMRSGIGPTDTLDRTGIAQLHRLDGVGRNLRDHPTVFPTYSLAQSSDATGTPIEVILTVPSRADSETQSELIVVPVTPAEAFRTTDDDVIALLVGLLRPYSLGRFEIRSWKPNDPPSIRFNFFDHPDDLARMLSGVKLVRELAKTEPFASRLGPELWPGPAVQSDEALVEAILGARGSFAHATSTCSMGPEGAPWSVVDQHGRVHGLEGLYVVDASIFPMVTSAGPNLTVMMVAERCAASLRDQLGVSRGREGVGTR